MIYARKNSISFHRKYSKFHKHESWKMGTLSLSVLRMLEVVLFILYLSAFSYPFYLRQVRVAVVFTREHFQKYLRTQRKISSRGSLVC
jgi:hypothetical protein